MIKESRRQTWVEIDLSALEHNIKEIKEKTGSCCVIGIVKADAYGHGAVRCARVLMNNGIDHFAVATIDEAIELREAGIEGELLILGLVPEMCADIMVEYELTAVVGSYSGAKALALAAQSAGKTMTCLIAIDSGMGRIGYRIETAEDRAAAEEEIARLAELSGLRLAGMISHFATSDEPDRAYTEKQLQLFLGFRDALSDRGIEVPWLTIANSAAILAYPETYLDAVRPGIILYGSYPSEVRTTLDLRPVMSVKANIVNIKTVPAGTAVSYGRKFVAERESRIATIALGYADGYSRTLSGKAEVLLKGKRVPIVGNICMDQCMIDATDVPDAARCDVVVIMGQSGEECITAEELAEKRGTIHYEVLCDFGMRLPKIYTGETEARND